MVQVAVSIRTVRKLAELLHAQLTSIQAPHAKAADADAFDALMRRIASLLHGVHDGALQLLIHCELQVGVDGRLCVPGCQSVECRLVGWSCL